MPDTSVVTPPFPFAADGCGVLDCVWNELLYRSWSRSSRVAWTGRSNARGVPRSRCYQTMLAARSGERDELVALAATSRLTMAPAANQLFVASTATFAASIGSTFDSSGSIVIPPSPSESADVVVALDVVDRRQMPEVAAQNLQRHLLLIDLAPGPEAHLVEHLPEPRSPGEQVLQQEHAADRRQDQPPRVEKRRQAEPDDDQHADRQPWSRDRRSTRGRVRPAGLQSPAARRRRGTRAVAPGYRASSTRLRLTRIAIPGRGEVLNHVASSSGRVLPSIRDGGQTGANHPVI